MNTLIIYDGFLNQKCYYYKNQYKNIENQRIFHSFCKKHSCTTNIKGCGPISVSRYVYVIYLSKTEGRGAELAHSWKQNCWRSPTLQLFAGDLIEKELWQNCGTMCCLYLIFFALFVNGHKFQLPNGKSRLIFNFVFFYCCTLFIIKNYHHVQ